MEGNLKTPVLVPTLNKPLHTSGVSPMFRRGMNDVRKSQPNHGEEVLCHPTSSMNR